MLTRTLMAVVTVATFAIGTADAQQTEEISGFVVLEMSGELAVKYATLTGAEKEDQLPEGLAISTIAIVAQHLDGGRIRIEHSCPVMIDGAPVQLVTLTATVDKSTIKTMTIPPTTKVYSSPIAAKTGEEPTVTKRETKQLTLELADLTGVKLRTWKLASEIGE